MQEQGQLWTGCADSGDLFVFSINSRRSSKKITLPGSSGVTCMIQVKNQIWVGCRADSSGDHGDGQRWSQVLVLDSQTHRVDKELQAHTDSTQTLCSAEGRYVLSGSARETERSQSGKSSDAVNVCRTTGLSALGLRAVILK
ncbi:hypothetical protein WMY93_025990 [Mugilogobius chulae]|uniref:Uncharacterized protein n=1 Tax=Mugilogobius chulae TaxID=88201 RepID=A0AAW0MZN5_9GOBI